MRARQLLVFASIATLAAAVTARPAHALWLQNGTPICTDSDTQTGPRIAYDGAGGAIVVWTDQRFATQDIYAQRVDSSGVVQWSTNGIAICTANGHQFSPTISPGYGGGAAIFWGDQRNGTSMDIYGQLVNGQGVAQWAFNGIALGATTRDEISPVAIPDNSSGLLDPPGWNVLWVSSDSGEDQTLKMQHVNTSAGGTWTSAAIGGVSVTQLQSFLLDTPVMVTDGVGTLSSPKGAIVAWARYADYTGTDFDVYARRVDNTGTPQWTTDGIPVCALSGSQSSVDLAYAGSGGVIVSWSDRRTPDRDLYAQKINGSGVVQWAANGLPICRAPNSQLLPRIIGDGAGGIFAVWQDHRGTEPKIYMQRLDANGLPLWTVDGIPICAELGSQSVPSIVPDGAGGAIVVWQDRRSQYYQSTTHDDLFAQRVDGSGNLLWPALGVRLCGALLNQTSADLVSDSKFGAIATWTDFRNASQDVYANRVHGSGLVLEVTAAVPTRARIAFVSSNPARGEVRMRLELPGEAAVHAEVVDATGRRVRMLESGTVFGSGTHVLEWDGAGDHGAPVAAGVYFVRVRAGAVVMSTRVVQLR